MLGDLGKASTESIRNACAVCMPVARVAANEPPEAARRRS